MISFEQIWQVLCENGATDKWKCECANLWDRLTEPQRERLYNTISRKLRDGKFVHFNPLRALRENLYRPLRQRLTYQEYYERYGTTEPQDGWQMQNPTGRQVIYVKL